jgi:LacI family transcriptional regulator
MTARKGPFAPHGTRIGRGIADGANKVTVRDVARAAGVSVATVSRVLNNPTLVAPAKQSAVYQALETLDYIPNQLARALISRRSKAIGLVVPTISNPVFAPNIEAIERVADQAGYALLIHCCQRDSERELKQIRALIERGIDGLILTGSEHAATLGDLLVRNKLPFISQDIARHLPLGPSIALDNVGAMELAIDHLVEQGHREIAVFTGPIHHTPPVADRFTAAASRIRHHGIDLPDRWLVVTDDYDAPTVRRAARDLVRGADRPKAIACTGDILSLGLVAECRAQGLAVPSDLSIIGCGNTDMGQYVDPPLTTVHMPVAEMGELAVRNLLSLIAGETVSKLTMLPFELLVRQSVQAAQPPRSRNTASRLLIRHIRDYRS